MRYGLLHIVTFVTDVTERTLRGQIAPDLRGVMVRCDLMITVPRPSSRKDLEPRLTPNHSNLIETAHAPRNAETGIHLPLLEAILQAQERDNIKVKELAAIDRNGVMPKRWNGAGARERHAAQRRNWAARKIADRNDQLTSYDTLKKELDTGAEENRQSLARQKEAEAEIKMLQEELVIDKRRSDFRERINALRKDVEEEKSERREWLSLDRLRKEELAGVRINGRRPERPSGEEPTQNESLPIDHNTSYESDDFTRSVDPTADLHDLSEYEPAEHPIELSISTVDAFQAQYDGGVDIPDAFPANPSESGLYSEQYGNDFTFNPFDHDQFDQFLLDTNSFESAGQIQPDNMWGYSSGEERLDPEPMQWTRASQELPHLPVPNFDPTPSPTPSQQQETNSDSPADLDDYVAPQDIDLELSERNIVTGKRQRTKSMRAGGPDLEERAPKEEHKHCPR
ncbi:hypothetical protein R3P38DRAFT_3460247 [Favolaschia claudopus]|uniref:Uncharacterized protein n=1 Tax=Favolaschia claudopus TaxID=2862362 RepID=A0AAV9ZI78_9AGAR